MARYTYHGGVNSLTIPGETPEKPVFEGILHDGKEVELPDHLIVRAWEARGWLKKLMSSTSLSPIPPLAGKPASDTGREG